MSLLLSPIQIGPNTFKNRVFVSPMCQYSSHDGFAEDWHLVHLGQYAIGQAALVITEAASISPEGRISPDDLGIWKDEHIPMLRRINDFIHQEDSLSGIQLAHAGRKASHASPWKGYHQLGLNEGGWEFVAPSAIGFDETDRAPHALSVSEIKAVIQDFVAATERSIAAGYDVVELHAAHGYLLHQFLSPLANKRIDEYGGSFENRIRFLMETITAVRKVLSKNQSLFVRISATDYADGGWDVAQSAALGKHMLQAGVDLVDVSSGALVPGVKIPLGPGYQVPFSEEIKKASSILTGTVGMITDPQQAEDILQAGKADVVLLGREFLRNPYWTIDAARQLNDENIYPKQYKRAYLKK